MNLPSVVFFAVLLLIPLIRGEAADVQLSYGGATDRDLNLPPDLRNHAMRALPRELPGRHIPAPVLFADLEDSNLSARAVPLPAANTLAQINFQNRHFGRLRDTDGKVSLFNPQVLLVKFRSQPLVSALRVEPMREWQALNTVRRRADVEFAELDTFERRQFSPDDPLLSQQWHHDVIGSSTAWNYGLGGPSVRIAIVDSPFQMDHPDLAANTVPGWDIDANQPVTNSPGIIHSTMCAGMAAAVINNDVGVAGACNCRILPININGAISEMYDATLWAATNGVRVVNISWSGGTNAVLEAAGAFLKTNSAGILIMSAVNGSGILDGPNQPDVYCISMTDAADNFQDTMYGPYIDFAAPGYEIFSTTTSSSYTTGTGCSFAAPLVAGVVAWMFSCNPALSPSAVISILQSTADNFGMAGWNEYYGWGRIDFAAAAAATVATLPAINNITCVDNEVSVSFTGGADLDYTLLRSPVLSPAAWSAVSGAIQSTNALGFVLTDPSPPAAGCFYRIQAASPSVPPG